MCSAIALRIGVIGSSGRAVAESALAYTAIRCEARALACRSSRARVRPSCECARRSRWPSTCARSMPCLSAIRLTTGEMDPERSVGSRSPRFGRRAPARLGPAVDLRDRLADRHRVAGRDDSHQRRWRGTGSRRRSCRCVTSQIVSSASTQSPGCLRHSTIVPSETEMPICGIDDLDERSAPVSRRGAHGRPPSCRRAAAGPPARAVG